MKQEPMTEAMYYLLLAMRSPGHGYLFMKRVQEISHGRVTMSSGTLYGLIKRLEEDGLIALSQEDGRRKTYSLTPSGEHALRTEYSRLQAMVLDGIALKSPAKPYFESST